MHKKRKTGFTLVEAIVVTAIIGLLSVIVIVPILNASKLAGQKAKQRNVTDVEKAKGQLTLPSGTVRGAMDATPDTPLSEGTGLSNLLSALSITNLGALNVGQDSIDVGTMKTKATYPRAR
jgi:prepilin-type N-terminal cleavage/methylation domain-containing protein